MKELGLVWEGGWHVLSWCRGSHPSELNPLESVANVEFPVEGHQSIGGALASDTGTFQQKMYAIGRGSSGIAPWICQCES